ncbi:helix-turn-helix domain-containing protein [Saccharothrix yanglingensis]|uniref:HTH cro/C1-type domain-containing protein n=1 Tax=Saccharothrix yanglingensis TaxID=659496 RepID=A0ABU0X1K9_9PSEU|nr:helix-turn-helix domain-containing protein [Saccharothrix yanglingensis]MDQ2586010.1 hypothetical protein [Saccharothrix yanglingensis]
MTEEGKAARQPARRSVYYQVLGAHLRQLRRRRDVSTVDMAERFGVSVAMFSKIEQGTRGPSPAALEMYAEVTGVPLLELLAGAATRHRERLDPFDLLLRVELPEHVRALDGLALYAGIPARHMPRSLPLRLTDTSGVIFGAADAYTRRGTAEGGDS